MSAMNYDGGELAERMKAAQEALSATGDGEEIAALDDPPAFQSFNRMALRIAHVFRSTRIPLPGLTKDDK